MAQLAGIKITNYKMLVSDSRPPVNFAPGISRIRNNIVCNYATAVYSIGFCIKSSNCFSVQLFFFKLWSYCSSCGICSLGRLFLNSCRCLTLCYYLFEGLSLRILMKIHFPSCKTCITKGNKLTSGINTPSRKFVQNFFSCYTLWEVTDKIYIPEKSNMKMKITNKSYMCSTQQIWTNSHRAAV